MKKTKEDKFKIKLNNGYQITADSYQYILQKVYFSSDGNKYIKNIAYAGSIENLIKIMLNKEIKNSFVTEFEQISMMINNTANRITKQITGGV